MPEGQILICSPVLGCSTGYCPALQVAKNTQNWAPRSVRGEAGLLGNILFTQYKGEQECEMPPFVLCGCTLAHVNLKFKCFKLTVLTLI